ncbi:MAG: site-specific integrase [Sedimentisphaerales bacterium]|jgi:integrase
MDEQLENKSSHYKQYERFGEVIRYLNAEELSLLFDSIDNYTHKLMFEVIFELGCRVGEFVRIQVKHLNFGRSTVYFPAENTKTKHARTSYLPKGQMNELRSILKQKSIISKRSDHVQKSEAYLFHPGRRWNEHYTENRIRQIFQKYIAKANLQQVYGKDTKGRNLKMFTVHSLRHSHIHRHVIDYGIPLPIVQKQVGHRSLKTTSVYLSPSSETIAQAYQAAHEKDKSSNIRYHGQILENPKYDH